MDDMISQVQVEEFDWDREDWDEFEGEFEWPEDLDDDPEDDEPDYDPPEDHFRDDVEADADALASAGFGTDEDYGYFGGDEY